MTGRPARQVLFLSAAIQNVSTGRCSVQVEIRGLVTTYKASVEGGCTEQEQLRSAAEATISALQKLGLRIELDAVELVNILGDWTVALRVLADHEGERRRLLGFCAAGNDALKATAFAVLNATNRFLEIG